MKNISKLVLATSVLSLGVSIGHAAAPYSDNFNTAHNYSTNGVTGTGWDDIINVSSLGSGSANSGGYLVLQSKGNNGWEGTNNTGAFLAIDVTGDFSMQVEYIDATGGSFAGGGLMAWSNSGDWISLYNHPHFGDYSIVRDTNDGVTYNNGGAGQPNIPLDRFLRMDRVGNNFSFYTKENSGDAWIAFGYSTNRPDMASTLSIGLAAANYHGGDPNSLASVRFENFVAVPEPGSALLLAAGCSLLGLRRRRS